MQKYTVNQYFVSNILNWVQEKEIAIPEIQRPFVWDSTKVRDLMDSLYRGFPIGYIIAWKNPDVWQVPHILDTVVQTVWVDLGR